MCILKDAVQPGELGKNEFLKILITQLQNQDPLKPMEDKDFIAQMAQFSALEQMQNLNQEFTTLRGLNLLGKTVYAKVSDENTNQPITITGTVDKASFSNGKLYLNVNGYDLSIDDIKSIYSDKSCDSDNIAL